MSSIVEVVLTTEIKYAWINFLSLLLSTNNLSFGDSVLVPGKHRLMIFRGMMYREISDRHQSSNACDTVAKLSSVASKIL